MREKNVRAESCVCQERHCLKDACMPIFLSLFLLMTGCKKEREEGVNLTLKADPQTVNADQGASRIIVELRDSSGNGIDGEEISLSSTGGALSEIVGLGNGEYSALLSNLKRVTGSPVRVTANWRDISDSIDITIVRGEPYTLTVNAEPARVNADAGLMSLTVYVEDYNNNPIPDAEVIVTSNYGSIDAVTGDGAGSYSTVLRNLYDIRKSPVNITVQSAHLKKTLSIPITPGSLKGFLVSPVLDPQFDGEPFSLVAVAVDQKNNTISSFNGTVSIIPSDTGVTVTPATSTNFVNGVLHQENLTINGTSTGLSLRLDDGTGNFGETNTFEVISIPLVDHFDIEPVPSEVTAGATFLIRLTAKDASNVTITDFAGTVSISDTTGTISPVVSQKFNNGMLAQAVSITKAQAGVTITVVGSTGGSGVSNSFTVQPASLDHFIFSNISSPKTVGTLFPITVTAVDAFDNQVTTFSGRVSISDLTRTIVPSTSSNFVNGLLLQQVRISKPATANRIKVDDGAGHNGESNDFEVSTVQVDHFTISAVSSPQTAGDSFTIVVEAQDAGNAIVTGFNGTVTLTDLTRTLDPVISRPFVSGVLIQDVKVLKAVTNNTITASWGGRSGTSNMFDVLPAGLNRFVFSPVSSPKTAGQAFPVTIEAVDLYGNRTDFNGTVNFSDLTGKLSPATSNNFTSGLLTQNVTISGTHESDIIIATDAGITGTSNAFEVRHGALDHFSFDIDPDSAGIQGISSPQRNGSPFIIRAFARDAGEALVTNFNGLVTISDLTGTISPAAGTFNNGILTLSVTISNNMNNNTITLDDGAGHTGVSNTFDVRSNLQVAYFEIDPVGTPQIAGVPFNITVTARKSNDTVDTTYNGAGYNVNVIDSTGTLKPYISGDFAGGVLTQSVTIQRAGTNNVITIEGAGLTAQSNSFSVLPAGLDHFNLNVLPSPQQVDAPFNVTVTAMDAFNNRFTGFNGTVQIIDRSGTLNITSAPFILGILNQSVSIGRTLTGNHIWVDDLASHTGASNSFDVLPQPLDHFTISNILSPQVEDEPFSITIVAQDASGRTITGFDGNVSFEDTTGSISPAVSDYFIGGVLTQDVRIGLPAAGTIIRVDDGAGHTGQSNTFAVEPSYAGVAGYTIDIIPTPQVAGQEFTITVRAVDSGGSTVSGFSGWVSISDTTGTISPNISGSFSKGILTQSVTITRAMSNVRITVQDTAGNSGTSNPFNIIPGALDHFSIANIPDQRVNVPFTISVTAQDAYNNTVSGFNGTVNIIDITGSIQPTTSSPFSAGLLSQEVAIATATPIDTVTVIEPGSGATGTSNLFAVQP